MTDYWCEDGNSRHRLLYVEYSPSGHPFSMMTEEHSDGTAHIEHWDCDRIDGSVYRYNSGGGGSRVVSLPCFVDRTVKHEFWAAADVELTVWNNRRKTQVPAKASDIKRLGLTWLEKPKLRKIVYCSVWPMPEGVVMSRHPMLCTEETDYGFYWCGKCRKHWIDDPPYCEHVGWCSECMELVYLVDGGHVPIDAHPEPEPVRHDDAVDVEVWR